ncbi:membrane protein [Oceanobacillus picturae]|uniref:Membrane protein n=2 Tax=Oceanobacillus picturae TaxID=171693 RepID=A0A0U9H2D6_9BACI|nr:membrane protein [Oceanobacillus picturae]
MVMVLIGIIWTFIGKLPGDFSFKKGNVTLHFPIMTSIIVSIILSLVFFILGKFR